MGDDYVFGSMLLPFLTALFITRGLMRRTKQTATLCTFVVPALLLTGFGVSGSGLWVLLVFGAAMGFFAAETERFAERF
ncbi:MAG: hypothetical protein AAF577_05390 [Pseudomonadota bacterium]